MSATLDPRRREAARLAELNRLGAMQLGTDRVLQELVDDAREVFGTEFCMVNLVTADAQFFKVWSGEMPPEILAVQQSPSERSMCRHVVEDEQPFVVEDFFTTERFKEQHLRMGPGVRVYAGTPLKTSEGHAVGALCLVDSRPRGFDDRDEATLRAFARAVIGRLEALGAASHEREAKESEMQYRQNVFGLANDAILIYSTETSLILDANRRACEMYGIPQEALVGTDIAELSLEREAEEEHTREVQRLGAHRGFETVHRRVDGARMHVSINSSTTEYGGQRAILSIVRDVTERKRTEESLRLSERSLAQAQRIAHIGNWEHELERGRTRWSDEMYRIFGFAPRTLVPSYKTFMLFVHPDDRDFVRGSIRAVLDGGRPEDVEYRIVRPDGEVRFVHTQYEVAYDGTGQPAKFSGTVHDVTDRKQVEKKLKEAEERYRLPVEQIPAVAYIDRADVADVPFYTSPRIEALLGYTSEEWLEGRLWLERLHPEDREWVLEADTRARAAEEPFGEEYRLIARDGRVVWVRDESELLRDEAGRPLLWQGILIDITERKRVEEELRQSEARFRTVFESSAIGISIADRNRRLLETNPAYQSMLGYSGQELLGKPIAEISHPADVPEDDELNAALVSGDLGSYRREKRYVRKDGEVIWVRPTISVVRDADGEPQFLVGMVEDITERKEREERFRTLVEQTPAVTYIEALDKKGLGQDALYISPQIEDLLGYSPEEWTSDDGLFERLLHPEDRERVLAEDARTERTGEPFRMEYRLIARDARTVWVRDDAVQVKSEEGRPRYWQGVMYDVTERKAAEAALRESEERLQKLTDAAFEGIIIHDGGEILAANKAYAAMHGCEIGEIVGRSALEWAAPEYRDLVRQHILSGHEEPYESAAIKKDGTRIDVEVRGRALTYQGRAVRVAAVRDVTERKRAEDALEESEERYRAVVEQSAEAIWLFDPETKRVLEANAAFQKMLGYGAEELRGMTNYDFVAHSREDVDRAVADKLRKGQATRRERKYRTKDGRLLDVEVGGTKISYRGKEVVCSAARDITERKRIEEEIRETNRRLGELATLKADFTAMVAHELDTPLAVIRGYADMLATGELGPTQSERALSQIQSEIEVLNALVEDVRIAASAERKDFAVVPRKVPVDELLDDAARFVVSLPGNHPLTLQHATDDADWDGVRAGYADPFIFGGTAGGPEVWADRYRIGQVLRNMLANAVKYSPEGTPIELRAVPDEAVGRVRIEVVDHGPGIHPDDMTRIFEKFGRGRDPEGRKVSGLGLGLYLSRRILQAHGSDLEVNAAPDGGSVFSFDLESAR